MSRDIKVAIIGCGKAGHMHAKSLSNIPECKFVAAQSRNPSRREEFANAYGVNTYPDIGEMVVKEKIDVVIVCTPHPNHVSVTEALEAGAHALIEKPLASTLSDCDTIITAAEKNGNKVGVVGQRRFYPSSMRMKRAIEDGKIGKPVLGTITMLGWRDEAYYKSDPWRGTWAGEGGGILVNQAPHQLDLFQWYMNDEFEELYGVWKNLNHPYIEVEDTALAIVKFKSGAIGNILVSNSQKPGIFGKVHVHGSSGASVGVQTDSGAMFIAGMSTVVAPPINDIWTIPGEEKMLAEWEQEDSRFFETIDPIEYYIRMQNRDFILAVLNDTTPMMTAREGRKTVELSTAIYQSTKLNAPVRWPLK
jgi:predicted dehydrogenase